METYFYMALFSFPFIWHESFQIQKNALLEMNLGGESHEFIGCLIGSAVISACLALGWPLGVPLSAMSAIMRANGK